MLSDNKTTAEIANELRKGCIKNFNEKWFGGLADRIEAANARERVLALKATETWIKKADVLRDKLCASKREIAELRECLEEALSYFCSNDRSIPCVKCWANDMCPQKKWRKALEGVNDEGKTHT